MSTLQRAAKNVGVLTAAGVLARLSGLVIGAFLARHLGKADFGTYRLCLSFASLFAVIAGLGIRQVVLRTIAGKPESSGKYLSTAIPMFFGQALMALVIMMLAANLLGYVGTKLLGVFIMGLATTLLAGENLLFAALEARERMGMRAAFLLARQVIWLLLAAIGISLGQPYIYFHGAQLLTGIVVLLVLAAFVHLRLFRYRPVLDLSLAKELYRAGLPLAGATILVDIYSRVDLIMVDKLRSADEVGSYAASVNLIFALFVLDTAITTVVFPIFSRLKEEAPARMSWATQISVKWAALALVPVSAILSSYSSEIIRIIYGADFAGAGSAFRILAWMLALRVCATIMGRALLSLHAQNRIFWISLASVALNVGGNFVLIPKLGIEGAAVASVVTVGAVVLLNLKSLHDVGLATSLYSILFRLAILTAATAWLASFGRHTMGWLSVPLVLLAYPLLATGLRCINGQDLRQLRSIVNR